MGSWLTYGLGTENQNLPGFIAMCPGGYPIQESQNWQAGFLPGVYQGTYIDTQHTDVEKLIEHVKNGHARRRGPAAAARPAAAAEPASTRPTRPHDPQLEARIQSFELAYRMQIGGDRRLRRVAGAADRSATRTARARRPGSS